MMKNRLLKRIAQIGSAAYQKRWVVDAAKDEYVLLDELIETTTYAAKHQATDPILSRNMSHADQQALVQFHDRVNALADLIRWNDPNVPIAEIVEKDIHMQEIRKAAQDCLTVLGATFKTDELMND